MHPTIIDIINKYLQRIANVLLLNASFIDNNGLLNGKTGITVFFYHYSRYTGDQIYEEYAGELVDEIYEEIHQNSTVDYINGLAGFGTGIEYLVKNGFIEADTDEVLEDLDKQIQHNIIHHTPHSIGLCFGITGIGKYFAARLKIPFNKTETKGTALNKEHLQGIIEMLHTPYNSYYDILSVIHLLSDTYPMKVSQVKGEAYLNYAIDKLETMVYEDVYFGEYPRTFNPLSVAATLIQASEKTGYKDYENRALHFLNMYEADFRPYLNNDFNNLSSGALKWSLLYYYLGVKLKSNKYIQLSEDWIKIALIEDTESLAGFRVEKHNKIPAMGILGGYAGIGLALLTLIDECPMDWLNLIPVYLEKEPKLQDSG